MNPWGSINFFYKSTFFLTPKEWALEVKDKSDHKEIDSVERELELLFDNC